MPLSGTYTVTRADDHELVAAHKVLVHENPTVHPHGNVIGPEFGEAVTRSSLYGPAQDFEIHHNVHTMTEV